MTDGGDADDRPPAVVWADLSPTEQDTLVAVPLSDPASSAWLCKRVGDLRGGSSDLQPAKVTVTKALRSLRDADLVEQASWCQAASGDTYQLTDRGVDMPDARASQFARALCEVGDALCEVGEDE